MADGSWKFVLVIGILVVVILMNMESLWGIF